MGLTVNQNNRRPTVFGEWLTNFLSIRGLAGPDGRALFRYRLSDAEFVELQYLLRNATLLEGGAQLEKRGAFVELWFLYAAEWWKRMYDGSAWSWKRIFDSIRLEVPAHATLRKWVDKSNGYWKLPQYLDHGRKYIGQVVLNGGVPLRLIEHADGHIATVLQAVLRRVVPVIPELQPVQVRAEIDAHAHLLPETFRQPLLLDLLTDVVAGVDALTRQFLRGQDGDPIEILNARRSDWRDRLPLELDCESARRLLSGLLREARVAERSARHPFMLRRGLLVGDDGKARFMVSIELANRFPLARLAQLLELSEDAVPVSFDLSLQAAGASYLIGRSVVRQGEVRVEILKTELPTAWFGESVRLQLSRFGEALYEPDLPGGEAPDPGLPWLFEDVRPFARLIRAGSCRLRAPSALALLPIKASLLCMDADEQELNSPVEGYRLVRLVQGEWTISNAGECFRVQCGAPHDLDESLLWHGRRLQLQSQPAFVFTGRPQLSRIGTDGGSVSVPVSELFWVSGNRRCCLASREAPRGAGRLVWLQDRHVQARLSAICLPEDAAVHYEAGRTSRDGVIRLLHWPALSVAGLNDDVVVAAIREGDNWRLDVRASDEPPPSEVRVCVHWPEGGMQELALPFPSQGVVLLHEGGVVLPAGDRLTVSELVGVRVRMLSPHPDTRWGMTLALRGYGNSLEVRRQQVYRAQSGVCEVRLFELMPMIRQMLASTAELDAAVEIGFESEGRCYLGLTVARYGFDVEKDPSQGVMRLYSAGRLPSLDTLAATRVLAVPLLAPDEPVELPALYSEGVANGSWCFAPRERSPGTWLIYPDANSACQFRPLAWFVPERFAGPQAALSELGQVLSLMRQADRLEQLRVVYDQLVVDPSHPDWSLLERMLESLGHLPATALDVWVALAAHPRAVAMAVLHLEGFAERLAGRFADELPFEWELISPDNWEQSLRCLKAYWQTHSDRALRAFYRDARDKLEALCQRYPALRFAVDWALYVELGETKPTVHQLNRELSAKWEYQRDSLFVGENCACQQLLRRSAETDAQWPMTGREQIEAFVQSDTGTRLLKGLERLQGDFKLLTISLPLMLAFQLVDGGVDGWLPTPAGLAALREYRDFDPDWFEQAYQAGLTFALIERQQEQ